MNRIDEAEAQRVHEIFSIFSVLKSHSLDLSEASAWEVAATILEESEKHSLDAMLVVALIKVESGFQHKVISTKGARGLMQIRPFVATALVEQADIQSWGGEGSLEDPIVNIKIGCFYLSHLEKQFGDLEIALTAYHWGPARVEDRLEGQKSMPLGFARNVIAIYRIYKNSAYERKNSNPYSSLGAP